MRLALLGAVLMLPTLAHAETVNLYAAGSLKAALTEVAAAFQKGGGGKVRVETTFGPSGLLREKIEKGVYRAPLADEEKKALLRRLTQVDSLERFMHKAYLGQKQFSIEGLDMTVPMLDEMIQLAAAHGAREVVVGMAHRGRLNVLAHNLGRPYATIFAEFEGASTLEAVTSLPQGGTGDVKYHHGAQGTYQLPNGDAILVNLESNPSHLEYVHPVVVGATRAAQTARQMSSESCSA